MHAAMLRTWLELARRAPPMVPALCAQLMQAPLTRQVLSRCPPSWAPPELAPQIRQALKNVFRHRR